MAAAASSGGRHWIWMGQRSEMGTREEEATRRKKMQRHAISFVTASLSFIFVD
jgi:hypothetical protein